MQRSSLLAGALALTLAASLFPLPGRCDIGRLWKGERIKIATTDPRGALVGVSLWDVQTGLSKNSNTVLIHNLALQGEVIAVKDQASAQILGWHRNGRADNSYVRVRLLGGPHAGKTVWCLLSQIKRASS